MTKDELIEKLNGDLADELGAIIQYIVYAARATGPYRPQLSQFFLAEGRRRADARAVSRQQDRLARRQATTAPREVALPEGNRAMLEAVVEAETHAMKGYTTRAQEAEAYGDKGLAVQLEDFIRDESGHLEETERILRDWPL